MREDDAVDLDRDRELPQPLAVLAVAAEGLPHLDEAWRHLRRRRIALGVGLELQRLEELVAPLDRVLGGKGGVFARNRQPQVAEHPRDFVIPEEQVRLAAGLFGFALEAAVEVERLS